MSLTINVLCQDQRGVDRMGESLLVNCNLIDNWEDFNKDNFEDIEDLEVIEMKKNDSLDFFKFKNVKRLALLNVKLSTPLVVSQVFPKLEFLEVSNNGFSNVSYVGLQDLDSLRVIGIGDKYFRKTATLSKLRNVKVLGINDEETLLYFKDHLDELLPDSLVELRIAFCSSRKTNEFMEDYFKKKYVKKVYVYWTKNFILKDYYNFDVFGLTPYCSDNFAVC
jgi:hypothetical protein